MEEVKKDSFSRSAMFYGAVVGVIIVAYTFVLYLTDLSTNRAVGFVQWAIVIACIYMAVKRYRDESCNGFISYGKALGFGTLTIFFASLITGFFTYLLYAVIDPSLIDQILQVSEEAMLQQGLSDDEIDMALEMTKKFTSPLFITLSTIFGMTFMGFIFTLIVAIFVKRKDDSFESNFQ